MKIVEMECLKMLPVAILLIEILTITAGYNISYDPPRIEQLSVNSEVNVTLMLTDNGVSNLNEDHIVLLAKPTSVLEANFLPNSWNCVTNVCNKTFKVVGHFLGFGEVSVLHKKTSSLGAHNLTVWIPLSPSLEVAVVRQDTIMTKLFTVFVATVVTINYINFGCALDIDVVKDVLKKPIGPAVGFFCQFVIMPLVSYGVGYLLFTDPVLRLGLFTFGCSPGGGASNMWTVLLGGNLNLSIAMTFVSTIAAFGTIPLWLFTLGQTILKDTNIVVPYMNIIYSLLSLIIPLAIGLLIQRYHPKVAARSKQLLAPICIILLIAIIVLASIANTYIFVMLSWSMIIASSLSVWTGFAAGVLASMAFRFPYSDVVAVSVETGVQNSGIAFVLLSYSLHHPVSDIASLVPIAASIITPIPLCAVYICKKARECFCRRRKMELEKLSKSKKDLYESTNTIIMNLDNKDTEQRHCE